MLTGYGWKLFAEIKTLVSDSIVWRTPIDHSLFDCLGYGRLIEFKPKRESDFLLIEGSKIPPFWRKDKPDTPIRGRRTIYATVRATTALIAGPSRQAEVGTPP